MSFLFQFPGTIFDQIVYQLRFSLIHDAAFPVDICVELRADVITVMVAVVLNHAKPFGKFITTTSLEIQT